MVCENHPERPWRDYVHLPDAETDGTVFVHAYGVSGLRTDGD